jgi:UDP-N-acetyl-D-mannosaminuronic acid dehydrogenase
MIKPVLQDGNLVVLESTVPPGTTNDVVNPLLNETAKSFFLAYVSEKAIPGNTIYEMKMNHRIIGGIDEESAERTKQVYGAFVESSIHLTDATTAETVKLLENTYRDINIAIANEFAKRMAAQDIDAWEAISLANLHPRVNVHRPGPGVGGHCLPIDPWFLDSDDTGLMKQARKINDGMPSYVVGLAEKVLNDIAHPTVVLLGVSYKADVDDPRESPSLLIKQICESRNIQVRLYDPHVKDLRDAYSALNEAVKDADCLILVTDHKIFKEIDPLKISGMKRKRLLDTRNFLDHDQWKKAGFIVKVLGK